jgi:AAA+ ATPase superfamily predicted ATPase
LVTALSQDSPSIIIMDEMPYLTEQDENFEAVLQKYLDKHFSRMPVLFIGIGSDLASMEALNDPTRPLYQRATEMVVPPLSPLEVGEMLKLEPSDAFDAYLVTGGLPIVCGEWRSRQSRREYLKAALSTSTSALVVSGFRALDAEFPTTAQARSILNVIGSGERTFANIANNIDGMKGSSLARSLKFLTGKRVVALDMPISTKPSKESRYRVADPYLRFWLRFIGPNMDEIDRGQGNRVLKMIDDSWSTWRGKAIEPVVRESLKRMSEESLGVPGNVIGGYWTRSNDPEIDIVIADRGPVAKKILAVGSIKWLETQPFDNNDLARLHVHRSQLPGATDQTSLIVVSRSGTKVKGLTVLGPQDLYDAWRRV